MTFICQKRICLLKWMAIIGRHANPKFYNSKELTPTQKKNIRIDKYKNEWAALNCIPLLRIWEYDIKNNSEKVMEILKERISYEDKKTSLKENKKRRGKKLSNNGEE